MHGVAYVQRVFERHVILSSVAPTLVLATRRPQMRLGTTVVFTASHIQGNVWKARRVVPLHAVRVFFAAWFAFLCGALVALLLAHRAS